MEIIHYYDAWLKELIELIDSENAARSRARTPSEDQFARALIVGSCLLRSMREHRLSTGDRVGPPRFQLHRPSLGSMSFRLMQLSVRPSRPFIRTRAVIARRQLASPAARPSCYYDRLTTDLGTRVFSFDGIPAGFRGFRRDAAAIACANSRRCSLQHRDRPRFQPDKHDAHGQLTTEISPSRFAPEQPAKKDRESGESLRTFAHTRREYYGSFFPLSQKCYSISLHREKRYPRSKKIFIRWTLITYLLKSCFI